MHRVKCLLQLTIIIRLGNNLDLVCYQVGRIETNTKLADHGDIRASRKRLHELLGTGTSDSTKVVDQVGFRKTNTSVDTNPKS